MPVTDDLVAVLRAILSDLDLYRRILAVPGRAEAGRVTRLWLPRLVPRPSSAASAPVTSPSRPPRLSRLSGLLARLRQWTPKPPAG